MASSSPFDPAVADPRTWRAGVCFGNAAGMFAIPFLLTPSSMRHSEALLGLLCDVSLIATVGLLAVAPGLIAAHARRNYTTWAMLPLGIGAIWLLCERLLALICDPSLTFTRYDLTTYVVAGAAMWMLSSWPVAGYRHVKAMRGTRERE